MGQVLRPTCARRTNLPTPMFPAVDTRQEYFNILERSSGIAVLACEVDTTSGSIQFDATAETLETRPLGELSSTAEVLKENKRCEVYAQCNYCAKRTRFGSNFCRCGQMLSGLTELQDKNAQITLEKGSQIIQSLVQLRMVGQVRRGQRHGTSEDQRYGALLHDHFRRCTRKGVLDQINYRNILRMCGSLGKAMSTENKMIFKRT